MYEKYLIYCLDMEDLYIEFLFFKEDKGIVFFGVYDGYGGRCYLVLLGIMELSDYNNWCINIFELIFIVVVIKIIDSI